MGVFTAQIQIETPGRAILDVTARIDRAVAQGSVQNGLANIFIRHTSASLIVSENADPDVLRDLETYISELVVDGDRRFRHSAEGPDDMAAHVRSVLTATSISVPVREGALSMGTWQAVYLWEHRHAPHRRRIEISVIG